MLWFLETGAAAPIPYRLTPEGSEPAPFALAGRNRPAAAFAVDKAALAEVIGRHFDAHGVADDRPDAETPHPARRVDDQPMTVFERDAEASVGQDLVDPPLERHDFLFGQYQADWRLIAETLPLRPVSSS